MMASRKRTIGAVRLVLVCSASAFVVLAQPSVAVAQTLEICLATATPARAAIAALRDFTFDNADVIDRDDVQEAIDSAIASLADNVLGEPSRLRALCERLAVAANSSESFITGDDCAATNSLTCKGQALFENYQDAVEALGEDAIPKIRGATKIAEVRAIVNQVYTAVRRLVELVIFEAETSSATGWSDSPAIVDALQNQQTAEAQTASCLDASSRACGDAVGSFFDAWLNGIIEIIE